MKPTFVETPDAPSGSSFGDRFDGVLAEVVAVDARIAQLEARRAGLLAEAASLADGMARAENGGVWSASVQEWARRKLAAEVACATRRTEFSVNRLVAEGEQLVSDMPCTLAELEHGRISYAHARAAIIHVASLPAEARGEFEARLVPLARVLSARRFDEQARRLRERAHPESIVRRREQAEADRHVTLVPGYDGMATLHHFLPIADALAIDDVLDKRARLARGDGDSRTHAQRRSDALTALVLGREDASAVRVVPTVIVTVPARTIAGGDDPAELHGYGPIDPESARELAARAPTFLRALLRADSADPVVVTRHRFPPRASERERYSASPALRTALMVADETCRFPGCGRRASRCELDHTRAWSEGGSTSADNLAHLCSKHHHLKHEGGWSVSARDRTRTLDWRSPRGAHYSTHPSGLAPP